MELQAGWTAFLRPALLTLLDTPRLVLWMTKQERS